MKLSRRTHHVGTPATNVGSSEEGIDAHWNPHLRASSPMQISQIHPVGLFKFSSAQSTLFKTYPRTDL